MAADTNRHVRFVTALVLAGTFIAGGVAGAGLMRLLPQPPPPPPPLSLRELNLTPQQEREVRAIHERHHPEVEAIVRATFPRVRAIQVRADEEVRAVLTPDQRRQLEVLKARQPRPVAPGLPPPGGFPPSGQTPLP